MMGHHTRELWHGFKSIQSYSLWVPHFLCNKNEKGQNVIVLAILEHLEFKLLNSIV